MSDFIYSIMTTNYYKDSEVLQNSNMLSELDTRKQALEREIVENMHYLQFCILWLGTAQEWQCEIQEKMLY